MPYVMKYDDVTNLSFSMNGKNSEWNDSLQTITKALNSFVEMESFKGQTADSVKAYISEVHFIALVSLSELMSELSSRYLLYKDGYYPQVDDHLHANLQEETLTGLKAFFKQSHIDFLDEAENVRSIAESISDLVPSSFPHEEPVGQDYGTTTERVTTLLDNAGEYESARYSGDFVNFDEMIASLTTFLEGQLGQDVSFIASYTPGTVMTAVGMEGLVHSVNSAMEQRVELQEELTLASQNEGVRFAQLEEEWAKQREEQGWLDLAVGALVVVGGIVCIVATAGLATPVVVTGAVVGGVTAHYGLSNMVESTQDIYYGMNGDYSTAAWNPMRDTLFMGNQQVYDVFGTVCVITSSIFSLGAGAISAASAAATAGTNAARAVAVYGGKVAFSLGAGAFGGWAGKEAASHLGASDTMSSLAGLLTGVGFGMLAGAGAQALDRHFNWSGFYREQAIFNEDFAKNPEAKPGARNADWGQVKTEGGYAEDANGVLMKSETTPRQGDVFDRYGDMDGTYVSPVEDGTSMPYDARSMPYGENPNALEQYRVTRDFSELPDAINNLPDGEFKAKIMAAIKRHWPGGTSTMTSYTGPISPAFGSTGGATQTQFPLTVDYLMQLGFLECITPVPVNPSLGPAIGAGAMAGSQDYSED